MYADELSEETASGGQLGIYPTLEKHQVHRLLAVFDQTDQLNGQVFATMARDAKVHVLVATAKLDSR